MLREHTHKNLLKSGHCPEGGGGSMFAQIAWSTFLHQLKDWALLKSGGVIGLPTLENSDLDLNFSFKGAHA